MTLSRIPAAFDHPDFLFELKHDGFRSLAYISDGHCELVSRKRNHYKSFHSLKAALADLKVTDAILDGEIVCLDWNIEYDGENLILIRESHVLTPTD